MLTAPPGPPVTIQTRRKHRFVVFHKDSILSIRTEDVSRFTINDGIMQLITLDGRKYLLKKSMKELEEAVDESQFFKTNRSELISFDSIDKVESFFGQRAVVFLKPEGKVIVSKSRLTAFLAWLDL